jgi:hypothetical protein
MARHVPGRRQRTRGQHRRRQSALVIVGESKPEQALDKAELKADKRVAKELDVSAKDVDKAVQEPAKDVS